MQYPLSKIIIGLLLGDGHIQQKHKKYENSRFIYIQSSIIHNHYNYFMLILKLFKPYISKNFKLRSIFFKDKRSHHIYSSISVATLTLPCFTYFNELFYNSDNRKIVPLNIAELLTPKELAY
jgi:LAGLIDADG DNA endonuclease family